MNEPKVVVVLLNYNQFANLCECIESLQKIDYTNVQILLIDNCSTDQSWDHLMKKYPEIPGYKTEHNSGYTGGVNFGFKKALELNPKYILVLNPDTIVTRRFLSAMVGALESDPGAAAAGGLVVSEHDRMTIWYAGGRLVPWRGLAVHFQKGTPHRNQHTDAIRPVTFLTGCMVLFRADVLKDTGMENEQFFLYLEDIEFSARMIKKGYRLLYVPAAMIYHKVLGEEEDILKLYYSVRNRMLLIASMNEGIDRAIAKAYFLTVISGKLAVWLVVKRRFFNAAGKGLKDYFLKDFYEGRGLRCFYKRGS